MASMMRPTEEGHERCACASTRPGISVAPPQSMTSARWRARGAFASPTASMRFPVTRISPENGGRPVPSKTCALVNSMAAATGAVAQNVKIGIVAFISGPAAAPFGVPAKNAADFVIDELNAGRGPAPYDKKGFGGATL